MSSTSAHLSAVTLTVQTLLNERHAVKDRTLNQPTGSGQWAGCFRGARRGHGTDFDDLRHYSPGDELRHIDWKASARTNILHTRLYREERDHRLTLVTDLRSAMFTGTRELRAVRACCLSARLLWQAIEGGSRTRVISVCDEGISVSGYGSGHRAAINACGLLARRFARTQHQIDATRLRASRDSAGQVPHASINPASQHSEPSVVTELPDLLITLPANRTADSPDPVSLEPVSMEQVAHWLLAQRHMHGTVIWISAFDRLGMNFNETMKALSLATRQVAVHVNDAMLEQGLPTGRYSYRSSDSSNLAGQVTTLSRKLCRRVIQHLQQQKQHRAARFSELLIPLMSSDTGDAAIVAALRQNGFLP